MHYFIGVDGGGTKTAFALFDENKQLVARHEGPGSNHENLEAGFDAASQIIWDGIIALLAQAGKTLAEVRFTLMGLAGIDHPFQYDIMCEKLRALGLERFEIFNDGFIVVKAGSETGAAIGYNCGTGTCCNAIDEQGEMLQLAGLGQASGDVAGGGWIAMSTFRLIYDEVYLHLHKTRVTELFWEWKNVQSREEFLGSIAELEGEQAGAYIRKLLRIFFQAAKEGDAPALAVVEEMAQRGSDMIAALANQMHFTKEVEVVLSGSIHTKLDNAVYLEKLEQYAREKSKWPLRFILLDKEPVWGCVNWIYQDYLQ